jgi:hypothetical protein
VSWIIRLHFFDASYGRSGLTLTREAPKVSSTCAMDVGIEDLLVCVTWKRQPRMESRLQTNVALTHAQPLVAGATHLADKDLLSGICLCWGMADGAEALAHYPGRITRWTPSRLAQGFSLGTQQVLIGGRQVCRLSKCQV